MAKTLADLEGVSVGELTPASIAQTLKVIYEGKESLVNGVLSLLTEDTITQVEQQGAEKFKEKLRNPGVVAAALADTGISIDTYEHFMHTVLQGVKGTVASRQAQSYASTAVEEVMQVMLPLSESSDGEYIHPFFGFNRFRS